MKLREVRAQNIRNFGPDALPVRFVDEATGQVRPLTVLVGSNGSGKTTLLELIYGACLYASPRDFDRFIGEDESTENTIQMFGISLAPNGAAFSMLLQVPPFQALHAPPDGLIHLDFLGRGPRRNIKFDPDTRLHWTAYMDRSSRSMPEGGIVSFPANRFLLKQDKAAISQPEASRSWLYRYIPSDQWEGSLEQLWVWQNYLDLEAQQAGRPSLLPFVSTIEEILGRGQTIKIQRGEVWIERPQSGDRVRPHELPSGEQQVLLIFGELLRRLRPGAIVMIDELEMNLHPGLQRVVIHHLRRLAQKHDLQIIVTTHSMEIVAACDPSEIVNLDDMVFVEQAARTAAEAQ
jgi:ABC-type lipoprotein export system ATPase subunit